MQTVPCNFHSVGPLGNRNKQAIIIIIIIIINIIIILDCRYVSYYQSIVNSEN